MIPGVQAQRTTRPRGDAGRATDPAAAARPEPTRPFATRRDDLVAGLCALWMVTGLFLDGWAHLNDKPESFFTPWHGVFYSGFTAAALWLVFVVRSHRVDGRTLRQAVPYGYGVRIIGVAVFGFGAVFDLVWHELFGIEEDIEALLSPSHLTLLVGGVLLALGPIASTFAREGAPIATWRSSGPIVVTVAFLVATVQFFLMYLSPYEDGTYTRRELLSSGRVGGGWLQDQVTITGVAAILVFTFTTTAALLWLVRNIDVPRGAFAAVFVVPAFLQTVLANLATTSRLLGPIAAALVAEATWARIRPRIDQSAVLALWFGGLTVIVWLGLLAGVAVRDGLGWQPELWTGVPVLAGLFATLLTVSSHAQPRS